MGNPDREIGWTEDAAVIAAYLRFIEHWDWINSADNSDGEPYDNDDNIWLTWQWAEYNPLHELFGLPKFISLQKWWKLTC